MAKTMRSATYATALLGAAAVAVAALVVAGVEARPASAADVNPYVQPLRTATAKAEATARLIATLQAGGTPAAAACRRAADDLARAAADAEKVLASYQNARLRYGTLEEFGLLRSVLASLYTARTGMSSLVGESTRPPTAAEEASARREVSLFRHVVAAKIAERFRTEGLEDVLTARSLRELKDAVVAELHGRLKTRIEQELRRITGVGISIGVPLKVQIRQQAELALSRLLSKLVFNAGPAGILIQLVAGKFVDPGRIVTMVGAKLREALRPKGNLASRTRQSLQTLEASRRSLNALARNAPTDRARSALRDADRAIHATRFLLGDLRRAGDTTRLKQIAAARQSLERTMRVTGFRFLLDAELLEYSFRDAIAFARRAKADALAAATRCAEQGQQPPSAQRVFTGVYSTEFGTMVLKQSGNRVTGCYTHDMGTLTGTVSGNVLSGTWREAPHKTSRDRGGIVYTKTPTGFAGRWNYDQNGGLAELQKSPSSGGKWNGVLVKREAPCTP